MSVFMVDSNVWNEDETVADEVVVAVSIGETPNWLWSNDCNVPIDPCVEEI